MRNLYNWKYLCIRVKIATIFFCAWFCQGYVHWIRADCIFLFLDLSTMSPSFYVRISFDRVAQHPAQYELTNSLKNYFRFISRPLEFLSLFIVLIQFKCIVSPIVPFQASFVIQDSSIDRGILIEFNIYWILNCNLIKIQFLLF